MVKIVSIVMFVVGIIYAVVTALTTAAAASMGADVSAATFVVIALAAAITVLSIGMAISGIKGANTPSKIGGFIVWAGICTAIAAIYLVLYIYEVACGGASDMGSVLTHLAVVLVPAIGLVFGMRVRKAAEK
ncbi:MAG: hypothetical protein LKK57_05755 [Atopobiaceae bacterium]|nr:hypothetical protein [Atopobiaceae bacterium]MCI2207841.1 hypothetical protein [Atopobiaceae bacterium]